MYVSLSFSLFFCNGSDIRARQNLQNELGSVTSSSIFGEKFENDWC